MTRGSELDRTGSLTGVGGTWSGCVDSSLMIIPDGAADVVWTPGRMPWIAGPDTKPKASLAAPGSTVFGVRLQPGAVAALISESAVAVVDERIGLDAVLSEADARRLEARLDHVKLDGAEQTLAALVGEMIGVAWRPDPIVESEIVRIRGCGQVPSDGLSQRQVRRRFSDAMGYGPKMFERICRLDRFTAIASAEPAISLATAAAHAGYHDQAHLSRDARALTGCTPAELSGRPSDRADRNADRFIQDEGTATQ